MMGVVIGFLLGMTVATVALALVLHADGAHNSGRPASVIVAALVLAGGETDRLGAPARQRAGRRRPVA